MSLTFYNSVRDEEKWELSKILSHFFVLKNEKKKINFLITFYYKVF
jgi:hypothetical protein